LPETRDVIGASLGEKESMRRMHRHPRPWGARLSVVLVASFLVGAAALSACSRTGLELFDGTSGLGGGGPSEVDDGSVGRQADDADVLERDASVVDANALVSSDASIIPGVVLFGGQSEDSTILGDTWVWIEGHWTQAKVQGPPQRYNHSMVSWNGTALLYGGLQGPFADNQLTDTWQWDGTAWQQLDTLGPLSNVAPIPMAELNGTVVAFVSNTGDGASTWVWDGGAWSLRDTNGPPKFDRAVMGTIGNRVIWAGDEQTWAWDGTGWTQLTAPSPVGSPSYTGAYMATLSTNLVYLVPPPQVATFDGNVFGGTATWNGASWTPLDASGPGLRSGPVLASTPLEAILFGGAVPEDGGPMLDDTWSWNGTTWTALDIPGPTPRLHTAMAGFDVAAPP
jgi:Kelch motif